ELLVGRLDEFTKFNRWLNGIPGRLSKSRVILARRKSGKTSFVQRIFNQLWTRNGVVVPFYFDFADKNIWLHKLALNYYTSFASQYISFLERDPILIDSHLTVEQIHAYAVEKNLRKMIRDTEYILKDLMTGEGMDILWDIATHAPHRYASGTDQRFLVILDEFQNIANHIYRAPDFRGEPDRTMPGSFHSLSESKVAPMLVTGSYPGILMEIMAEHLEAGRLSIFRMNPFLTPDEGLAAVEQYAETYQIPIKDETAAQLNDLCGSDPFLISCVMLNDLEGKNLMTEDGVVDAVTYEVEDRNSEMSKTWSEYLRRTFKKVNGTNTKKLMLFLNKNNKRYWTPRELKKELNLELSEEDIFERLEILVSSDVIDQGSSDIRFCGLKDGTLNRVLRSRFQEEIENVVPDFRGEFEELLAKERKKTEHWLGKANEYKGLLAERTLVFEFRMKQLVGKPIRLSDYFSDVADTRPFNIVHIRQRLPHQRLGAENKEIDVLVTATFAETGDDLIVMVEVRDRQRATGIGPVTKLHTNAVDYGKQHGVTVLPAYLSRSGFTKEAKTYCQGHGIGMAEEVASV
ncbi:MAG: hypothetical protein AAF639_29090, partial [Chloroflexota bacterium]